MKSILQKKHTVILRLCVGAGILFFLWQIPWVNGIWRWGIAAMHWPWQRTAIFLQERGELIFASKEELAQRNAELEEQLRAVALSAAAWQEAARTLPDLEKLLGYTQNSQKSVRAARVLFFTEQGQDRLITLDQGLSSGVRVGQVVVAHDGLFVGVIESVQSYTARVRLLTSPLLTVGGMPMGTQQTIAIVHGDSHDQFLAEYIPRSLSIDRSTFFVTSGTDTGIPSGLIIGKVERVIEDPALPYVQAVIMPLVDARRLSWMGILE